MGIIGIISILILSFKFIFKKSLILFFSRNVDISLILFGSFIARLIYFSFMNCSFVTGEASLLGCFIRTKPARVLDSFMNCSFVEGEVSDLGCFIRTKPARVLDSFMNCSFVLGKI